MQQNDYVYRRFIKIILPICIVAFLLTITLFEFTNYYSARTALENKLDKLSATYSLLYAEPIAMGDIERIRSYSVALISDPEIALIRVMDRQGNVLDSFDSGRRINAAFTRDLKINYATENNFQQVGKLRMAVCTNQINQSLQIRVKNEIILLLVLIASVLISVGIAFQRSVDSSLRALSHQASHDPLTDLVNRRAFESRLEHVTSQRRITDHYHKLLYLDLDGFKKINDDNGHLAGDDILKQVAGVLVKFTRTGDFIARLGGDEFGILLLNCSTDKAVQIGEKIRFAIEKNRFSWKDKVFKLGISIGIASIKNPNQSYAEYINMADEACYAAKRKGRNRIQLYDTIDASHI